MAVFFNEFVGMGNLVTDPDIRYFADGTPKAEFRLAISKKWKDKNGEWQEKATFVPLAILGDIVTNQVENKLHKGDNIWVRGEINNYSFPKSDGTTGYGWNVMVNQLKFIQHPKEKPNQAPTPNTAADNAADDGNPY